MPVVERSVLLSYSAERMFDLVADVDAYPQFLPWCAGAQVHSREPQPDGSSQVVASLRIQYAGVSQSFSTVNTERPGESLHMVLREGPFKALEGQWTFTPLGADACKVEFRLRYEFSSRLLASVVGPVFDHIAKTFVDGFVRRADQRYG